MGEYTKISVTVECPALDRTIGRTYWSEVAVYNSLAVLSKLSNMRDSFFK